MPVKTLGRATFYARRAAGTTVLAAAGTVPYLNTKFDIEQLPFLGWPPIFAFYFVNPDIALPALRPFVYEEVVVVPASLTLLRVEDAVGLHEVPIIDVEPPLLLDTGAPIVDTGAIYCVFRSIGMGHMMIGSCTQPVPMTYQKVFGPDTHSACEAYIAANSGGITE